MAGKNTATFGIYQTQVNVEDAVDALRSEGFRNADVSVLFPENKGTKDFAVEKNTKAPEGTATGAATGGAIGGVLGWLAGIGTLAIPGVGPLVAAGPMVATLTGVGVGGAIGGIAGALVGMGIPEYEAKRYEAESRVAEFYSAYIATIPIGQKRPKTFWLGRAQLTSDQPLKPRPTGRRPTSHGHAPVFSDRMSEPNRGVIAMSSAFLDDLHLAVLELQVEAIHSISNLLSPKEMST